MKLYKKVQLSTNKLIRKFEHSLKHSLNRTWNRAHRSLSRFRPNSKLDYAVLITVALCLLVVGAFISGQWWHSQRYNLNPKIAALIGPADQSVLSKVKYKTTTHSYNLLAAKSATTGSVRVGTPPGQSSYGLSLPGKLSNGFSVTDPVTELSMNLVPTTSAANVRMVDHHFVYPLANYGAQAVYTVKGNGLEEDIVVPHGSAKTLTFGYQLKLPSELQARLLPDGSLGIYSASSALYGNISYGSSADQRAVMTARNKSPKNSLVFVLPVPRVENSSGHTGSTHAAFKLNGNQLVVNVSGTANIKGPLLVDPSVVVVSSSLLIGANNEGDISIGSSNFSEAGLDGGVLSSSWSTTTSLPNVTNWATSVVYNGYVYEIGGYAPGPSNTVDYAPINSNGTLGSWTATASLPTSIHGGTSVAYNGYVYEIGGCTTGGCTNTAVVDYAPINSNGTLGSWTATTSLPSADVLATSVVYNGYVYEIGGNTNGVYNSFVDYAPINSNGTLGSWTATTSLPTATNQSASVVYNGYVYEIGGYNNSGPTNVVDYAPINSNGTLGSWTATTSLPNSPYFLSSVVYNGYVYTVGGYGQTGVYYAQINSNGTLGSWTATTSLSADTYQATTIAYNGYVYVIGGQVGGGSGNASSIVSYDQIEGAGYLGSQVTNSTTLPNTTYNAATAVYNGYIYELGGYNGSTVLNETYYAQISSSGTIGAWSSGSNLAYGIEHAAAAAYGGYIYLLGGFNGSSYIFDSYCMQIGSLGAISGTWSNCGSLPQTISDETAVVYNNYIYSLGGYNGTTDINNVYCGNISTPGTISTWTCSTVNNLPNATEDATAVENDGFVYFMGGNTGGIISNVYWSQVNSSNGSLGAWTAASGTSNLNTAVQGAASEVYNGYIYVVGGGTGLGPTATIQYAPLLSSGGVGAWSTTTSLSTPVKYLTSAIYNGFIYALGGENASTAQNTIVDFPINNGGSGLMQAWSASGIAQLPTATQDSASVVYNGRIYEIGGYTTADVTTVEDASINTSTGAIGSWSSSGLAQLPTATQYPGSVAYNGYIYNIGGTTNNGTTCISTVQSSAINASTGGLGTWTSSGNTQLPVDSCNATTIAYNGYVYLIGGDTGSTGSTKSVTTVYEAPINSNGTIGTWHTLNTLPNGVELATSDAYNGYLYEIDGSNFAGTRENYVEFAPINSNGTIGSWTQTSALPSSLQAPTSAAYNGYLYVIAGNTGNVGISSTIWYASINSNGSIGQWTSNNSLPAGSNFATSVVYDGYVYQLGGATCNGCSSVNTVDYTTLFSIPRTGYYSILLDTSGLANVNSTPVETLLTGSNTGNPGYGNSGAGLGGTSLAYSFADDSCVEPNSASYTAVNLRTPVATNLTTNGCATSTGQARYVWLRITLDDSQTASFPDVNGNKTSISSINLYYHPATAYRLTGGETLINGSKQSLDAVPIP